MNRSNRGSQKTALRRTLDPLLPAILVIGGAAVLTAKSASAIELGQLQVHSTLGQPLSASIAYVLNPHEQLHSYCISLTRNTESAVQSLTRANVKIVGDKIVITGSRTINEPMLGMRVAVNCPYTVKLARNYVVMINPAGMADAFAPRQAPGVEPAPAVANVAAPVRQPSPVAQPASAPVIASAPEQPVVPVGRVSDESPVYIGDDYRVQTGDSLSKIAKRIDDRPTGLWSAIDALFQANPQAFVANDKNRLIAGSMLFIPDMQGHEVAPVEVDEPAPVESFEAATTYVADTSSYEAYDSNSEQWADEEVVVDESVVDTYDPATSYTPESSSSYEVNDSTSEQPVEPIPEADYSAADDAALADDTAVLSSGDSGIAASQATNVAADTAAEVMVAAPVAASPVSDRAKPKPAVVANPPNSSTGASPSWVVWAGSGGAALFLLGLLFAFRRKIGGLFGGDDAERVEPELADDNAVTQNSHVLSDVDFPLDDIADDDYALQLDADLGDGIGLDEKPAPEIAFAETTELDMAIAATAEASGTTELDADLGAGTGLQGGTDLDVAQDFGFSATDENAMPMDLELPVEAEVEAENLPTDIIPPHLAEQKTILDEEVPPVENDDDSQYDLSMIVDATKQALGEHDLTAKDLNAVQLDAGQPDLDDAAYTFSKEVDFKILEQDYEEELTQTQAVNEEIAKAAVELAQRMEVTDAEDDVLDVTAEMPSRDPKPAQNDPGAGDSEATAFNEALTIEEEVTVKINLDDDDTVDSKNLG